MPLANIEGKILRLLAGNRHPDSFVSGATVLLQSADSPRFSKDVDYFHDTISSLSSSAESDAATLRAAGFEVEWRGRGDACKRATVRQGGEQTKIEWVFDSAFRFFPVEADAELGWRLNFWDAATNKVLAFAGRSKIRDLVDVLHLHDRHLHLGALAWAASGKVRG